jgi:ribonuclease
MSYKQCNTCGAVMSDTEPTCVNTECTDRTNHLVTVNPGQRPNQTADQILDRGQTVIAGTIPITYQSQGKTLVEWKLPQRDLRERLTQIKKQQRIDQQFFGERLRNGGQHKNAGRLLPVLAQDYYKEFGLSVKIGYGEFLSSEKLVFGKCGELYYTADHYGEAWWVYNPDTNAWMKFKREDAGQ